VKGQQFFTQIDVKIGDLHLTHLVDALRATAAFSCGLVAQPSASMRRVR